MREMKSNKIKRDAKYLEELAKYNLLKTSFSKLFAERSHLIGTVKKNVEALYIVKIGKNEYKLFELECDAARLKRKIELIQAMRNRAEEIDLRAIEEKLDEEYASWEKQIGEFIKKLKNSKERLSNLMSGEKSAVFQKLYRKLVKRLHPDINIGQCAGEKELWNRLAAAYGSGDLEELETIEILLENDEKTDEIIFNSMEKIQKEIEKIKLKIKSVIADMDQADRDFPLNIKDKINDPVWVDQKNKETNDQIMKAGQRIKDLKAVVDKWIMEAINSKSIKADSKGSLDG